MGYGKRWAAFLMAAIVTLEGNGIETFASVMQQNMQEEQMQEETQQKLDSAQKEKKQKKTHNKKKNKKKNKKNTKKREIQENVQTKSKAYSKTGQDVNAEEETALGEDVQTMDQTKSSNSCSICFFDSKGMQIGSPVAVQRGMEVELDDLIDYAVDGYDVLWKDRSTMQILQNRCVIQNDLELEAELDPVDYNIEYNKNCEDAIGQMEAQSMTYGRLEALKRCTYVRPGYVFAGWATTEDGARTFDDEAGVDGISYVRSEGDTLTLYAVWNRDAYTITYQLNNGKNNPNNPTTYSNNHENLALFTPTRDGYIFGGWFLDKNYQERVTAIEKGKVGNITLYAKWIPKTYKISYQLNGGKNGAGNPKSYQTSEKDITLAKPTRKGYRFQGWYPDKDFKQKKIKKIEAGTFGNQKLYAKWKLETYRIVYHLRGGQNVSANRTSYTMQTKTFSLKRASRNMAYFRGWYLDEAYTKRIKKIKKGTTGRIDVYAKWEKEYVATANSAQIRSCYAKKKNVVRVTARVGKRINSKDGYYYLAIADKSGKSIAHVVKKVKKRYEPAFNLKLSENRGYALAHYVLAVRKKKGNSMRRGNFQVVSPVSNYVQRPEKLAVNRAHYKYGKTKKGLQTTQVDQVLETGSSNMFLNLNISDIYKSSASEPAYYKYNGKTYKFSQMGGFVHPIKKANAHGINVTLQINLDQEVLRIHPSLIDPRAREGGKLYYAWNTVERSGREEMEALFCYLAETFGKKGCYVSNWILGNEINACNKWYWRGSMTDSQMVSSYAYTFRSLYNAVLSVRRNSKIYTCMDHVWKRKVYETDGMNGKRFLHLFDAKMKYYQSNVKWNIAIHPYTVNMSRSDFWDSESYYARKDLVTRKNNTEFITMKNLYVFTHYVRENFGGQRSISISELGFDGHDEKIQAAAIAYAYNIAACNKAIDFFIIRSYHDEAGDGGLKLGIKGRKAYNVFKYMDTKYAEIYTKRYIRCINRKKKSWRGLMHNYAAWKLRRNYRS